MMDEKLSRSALVLGEAAMDRLAQVRVMIFGVGGVGGWCAEALVRTGLKRLTIVDFDRVAASNCNRQAMALSSTLGELKVDALKRRLLDIAPDASIETIPEKLLPENLPRFDLDAFDYVIDAIDSVESKAALIRGATACPGVTLFSSMGAALRLDPALVRADEFRKVSGDGLAKALRGRFRQSGGLPEKPFVCVYSAEAPLVGEQSGRGSVMTVTAAFGLKLAQLVLADVKNSLAKPPRNMV
jgi:tRNA A37 threonylcarbamoyladenosine dehydratase